MKVMSRGAEDVASPQFFVNNLSTGCKVIHRSYAQGRGVGGYPQGKTKAPTSVKSGPCLYNTPQRKIYAKVKMS